MNNDSFTLLMAAITGIVIGSCLTILFVLHLPCSIVYQYHEMIAECEKTLPRTQTCVTIAVPKEVKK